MDTTTNTPASAALARLIYAELCGELPLPVDTTPESRALRDEYAMASVDALHPANAIEARLAVRAVAMGAHAADALREHALAAADPMQQRRCRAQAISMARQSDAVLRTLHRIQARREKQEAEMHPSRMERDGYWWRGIKAPEPAAEPAPDASAKAPEPPPPTQAEIEAEAERYAVIYPDRAARIRAAGGLPADLDFGPPDPEIVAVLLRGGGHTTQAPRQSAPLTARDDIS